MKINKYNLEGYLKRTSNLFLILLFPGFVIYNIVVAYNIIPPILGGGYGIISVIYLACMLPVLLSLNLFLHNATRIYIFLLVSFCGYLLFVAFLNYFIYYDHIIELAVLQTVEALFFMLVLFLLGFFVNLNKRLYFLFISFIVVSLVLILFYIFKTGEVVFYVRQLADESVSDSVSSYQGFARSAMVVSLVTLSMTNVLSKYMLIFLFCTLILFFLGARSELIGTVFAAALLIPLKFKVSFTRLTQLALFSLLMMFSISLAYRNFSTNRIFQLLDVSEAGSWVARSELKEIAIKQIKENPLFGYFGGHIIDGGTTGSYSHNFLSAWAGFGFITFLIYILLCLIPVIEFSLLALKKKSYSNKFYLCLGFGLAILLLVITSKSLYWFMPGLVWGMYLNVKRDIYER